jgi:hypothetical protein
LFAVGGFVVLLAVYGAVARGAVLLPVFMALFSVAWFVVGVALLRRVEEIYLEPGGMVEFVRGVGATRIAIDSIHRLEGKYTRDYDGDPVWHLRVHYREGRLTVDPLGNARDFVNQVRAHNPAVTIDGMWPMEGLPPPPGR